jgi:hypothetical protein
LKQDQKDTKKKEDTKNTVSNNTNKKSEDKKKEEKKKSPVEQAMRLLSTLESVKMDASIKDKAPLLKDI